jgi:hypothetical protein
MAAISDAFGDVSYGFKLATVFTLLLAVGLIYNWLRNPAGARLAQRDQSEYSLA